MRKISVILIFHICIGTYVNSQYCFTYFEGSNFKADGSLYEAEVLTAGPSNSIWFGLNSTSNLSNKGLVRVSNDIWTNWNTSNSQLPDNHVNAIAFDKLGTAWVGTDGGLFSFNALDASNVKVYKIADGLPENKVTAIFADSKDTIWLGFSSGKIYKLKASVFSKVAEFAGQSINTINSKTENELWLGLSASKAGQYGLVKLKNNDITNFLENQTCFSIGITSNNKIYFNSPKAIYTFDNTMQNIKKLYYGVTYKVTVDNNNNAWFNSNDTIFNVVGDSVKLFTKSSSGFFPNGSIVYSKAGIAVTTNGDLWYSYFKSTAALSKVAISNSKENLIAESSIEFCDGKSTSILAKLGFDSYIWSTGETTNTISSTIDRVYTLSAFSTSGGSCYTYDTIHTIKQNVYQNEKISLVTVDNISGKNMVVWLRTKGKRTASYNIWKETEKRDEYVIIGTKLFNELSVFVDESSVPGKRSERYRIQSVDSCGNFSQKSLAHKTLHLTINVGVDNEFNLIWENYEGVDDFKSYKVYRGFSPDNMIEIETIPNNITSYTDKNVEPGNYYYQIAMVLEQPCSPEEFLKAGVTFHEVVSNTENKLRSGNTLIKQVGAREINVYPNPTHEKLKIDFADLHDKSAIIEIFNIAGVKVCEQKITNPNNNTINISNLGKGVYCLKIYGNAYSFFKHIVVE